MNVAGNDADFESLLRREYPTTSEESKATYTSNKKPWVVIEVGEKKQRL